MRRREFIVLLGSAGVAWPRAVRAQRPERIRQIAVLAGSAESDPEQRLRLDAFRQALRQLGWTEDRNVAIDSRYAAGDASRIQSLARALAELRPDVIVAATTPVVAAFKRETQSIPIVFVRVSDPVGSGFAASLARPGGNITGFLNIEASLGGKWVELLKEIAPGVTRVAMMFNPRTALHSDYYLRPFENAARSFGVEPIAAHVHNGDEIERSIADLARDPGGGMIVMSETFVSVHRERIISRAAHYGVPSVYPYGYYAKDGGLVSYGVDLVDAYRQAASYVDRILKGEKPSELPVQAPTKFELVVNLKTAKALGISNSTDTSGAR